MRSRQPVVVFVGLAAAAVFPAVAVAVAAAAVPARAAAHAWQRPVEGAVLRAFSVGPDRFAPGQHRGVDLAAPPRAPVRAACGGRVSFAGRVPRGGLTVSVRCGRLVATHQHLGVLAVRRGQIVLPGARIGRTGRPRPGAHVHLGARLAATGSYVDPLSLLAGTPRAAPPPVPAGRRPPPLPSRPALPSPQRVRPTPTVAPAPAPAPAQVLVHVRSGAPDAPAARMPVAVWLGLALFGLGLPLGGLVRVRTRRRRTTATVARTVS
jgi:murein DD-endopeptidase MepM/ murein hydrolase activator NlpD